MRRFGFAIDADGGASLHESEEGEYVLYDDAQAAVSEARRETWEEAIALLRRQEKFFADHGRMDERGALRAAVHNAEDARDANTGTQDNTPDVIVQPTPQPMVDMRPEAVDAINDHFDELVAPQPSGLVRCERWNVCKECPTGHNVPHRRHEMNGECDGDECVAVSRVKARCLPVTPAPSEEHPRCACGGTAYAHRAGLIMGERPHYVRCDDCGAQTHEHATRAGAWATWDRWHAAPSDDYRRGWDAGRVWAAKEIGEALDRVRYATYLGGDTSQKPEGGRP